MKTDQHPEEQHRYIYAVTLNLFTCVGIQLHVDNFVNHEYIVSIDTRRG